MIEKLQHNTFFVNLKQVYWFVDSHFVVNYYAKIKNNLLIKKIIASQRPIYLELGSGPKKGTGYWLTADICKGADLRINLLNSLPFPDNSVDKIYSSHVLEHFSTSQIEYILGESLRVLKSGGIFSVCVPNAAIYLNTYHTSEGFDPGIFCRYKPGYQFYSKIDYINYIAYMGGEHKHMFDQENLLCILARNGFRNVQARGFDRHLDMQSRDYQSIYAEGQK